MSRLVPPREELAEMLAEMEASHRELRLSLREPHRSDAADIWSLVSAGAELDLSAPDSTAIRLDAEPHEDETRLRIGPVGRIEG